MTGRSQSDAAPRAAKEARPADTGSGPALLSIDSAIFKDVQVALQAKLGEASLTIEDLLSLKAGSVLTLDMKLSDLVPLHLNGSMVARGEIVAVEDNFGIRIVEIAPRT